MKTWTDVEIRAMYCPVLYNAVTYANRGDCTREEALIDAAIFLSNRNEELIKAEVDRRMRERLDR